MYNKGEFKTYVKGIKRLVKKGEMSKAEANICILGKAQQMILNTRVSHKQFMDDRKFEAMNYD